MPRQPSAIVQYKLRIREALRRRIERAAKEHGVSANQEMVRRLEQSFDQETTRTLDDICKVLTLSTVQLAEFRAELRKARRAWAKENE